MKQPAAITPTPWGERRNSSNSVLPLTEARTSLLSTGSRADNGSRHGIIELWQVSLLPCANALDVVITVNAVRSIITVFIGPPSEFDLELTCYR